MGQDLIRIKYFVIGDNCGLSIVDPKKSKESGKKGRRRLRQGAHLFYVVLSQSILL
jgi:hypothetical protein